MAEHGVILLMVGVGNHFALDDLLAVRRLALPGALLQVAAVTALGIALAARWGWGVGAGLVLGLALSVARTVVLLRALEDRADLATPAGRVAVGWLVVEDLIMVLALVLLPAVADSLGGRSPGGGGNLAAELALTLGKVALFVAVMLIAGVRLVPWLLTRVERTGSRELFILATLAAAFGIAYGASELFGVSFALGAFLAGVVVNESELSHRAAEEALPLREAFAVLFFVSVGMLLDPAFLLEAPGRVAAVAAVILLGKAAVALLLDFVLRGSRSTGLTVAAGLSQIGEFSFILAEMGRSHDLLPEEGRNLILAGALLSITLNPILFRAVDALGGRIPARPRPAATGTRTVDGRPDRGTVDDPR